MGDQPEAIRELAANLRAGVRDQVLLGATGTGKTFTMANLIAEVQRPALVMAPNKTLAAQLYNEFRGLFPHNAVEYFVSYYDYYQPEAYLPHSDTYIEKDSSINDDIDKLRHAATHALLTRRDVVIVASVSCIYGLGSPEYYAKMIVPVETGQRLPIGETHRPAGGGAVRAQRLRLPPGHLPGARGRAGGHPGLQPGAGPAHRIFSGTRSSPLPRPTRSRARCARN